MAIFSHLKITCVFHVWRYTCIMFSHEKSPGISLVFTILLRRKLTGIMFANQCRMYTEQVWKCKWNRRRLCNSFFHGYPTTTKMKSHQISGSHTLVNTLVYSIPVHLWYWASMLCSIEEGGIQMSWYSVITIPVFSPLPLPLLTLMDLIPLSLQSRSWLFYCDI